MDWIDICEDLGWCVEDHTKFKFGYFISRYTPAGEDFGFYIEGKDPASEVISYFENFDPEEHAILEYGVPGAPCLRDLLDDADKIYDMLEDLGHSLKEVNK